MDFSELKKLLKNSTSVLVLDNGEPSFVVLGYRAYKELCSSRVEEKEIKINPVRGYSAPVRNLDHIESRSNGLSQDVGGNRGGYYTHERESEILERLNKEILALKSQIEMEERGGSNPQIGGID